MAHRVPGPRTQTVVDDESGLEVVDLGIDLATFDFPRSIDMESARTMMAGRHGAVARAVVTRWASRGCVVGGLGGRYILFLPVVQCGKHYRTMPSWVILFERKRLELSWINQTGQRQIRKPVKKPEWRQNESRAKRRKCAVSEQIAAAATGAQLPPP